MMNSPKSLIRTPLAVAGKAFCLGILCASMVCGTPAIAGTTTYQYDSLGRVIKVTYPDSKQICYAYDSAGNRTQVKRQATGTCTVAGSTLTSSLTAETMFAAQQSGQLEAMSGTTTATDDMVITDDAPVVNDIPADGN